ncbi:MAG TPA: bestrophin family ion channel [Pyrinomonadaceae bacterium]|jgi:putative membrane protein
MNMIEYDAHNWTHHLFDIKGSVIRQVFWRVMLFVLWAAAVVVFHEYVRAVHVPSTVHTLIGVALGLLLVFRTNASYERFWEGRRMWGGIVNESRNLARATSAFLHDQPALREQIILWTAAFSYACMQALRGEGGLGAIAGRLPKDEAEETLAAQHVPSAIALRISSLLSKARAAGHLSDYLVLTIDNNVQLLIDYLGACERIQKTPLPFAYVVHLRRALILYCVTLPFALVETYGWATVVDMLLISYILFGIEEIGVEIENPFGVDHNDLPLEQICLTIERNLISMIEEEQVSSRGAAA